jgi:lipoprotein signal peptidase
MLSQRLRFAVSLALSVLFVDCTTKEMGIFWRTPLGATCRRAALGLLIGGALGNLQSRVVSPRGVVDFIDLGLGSRRFYLFNVADLAIVTGACILALTLWPETLGPPADISWPTIHQAAS